MADQARPEQLLIAAASAYALLWPMTAEERVTIRQVLTDVLEQCDAGSNPAIERIILATRRMLAGSEPDDSALRLALGRFFYRRMGAFSPDKGGIGK